MSLKSIIETHEDPFVVLSQELVVVAVNRAYERQFEVSREDLLGRRCYEVFQCQERPCWENDHFCPHRQILDNLRPYAGIFTQCDPQGGTMEIRAKGFPIADPTGQIFIGEILSPVRQPGGGASEPRMVGRSAAFAELLEKLNRGAAVDIPLLLEGETGTGKELAAAYLHAHSGRKQKKLVTVDCTVLPEDLFESELFGHEKGAFTGSTGSKAGLFELADGGTLFLDEVGEMPLAMQAKLLRALESGGFRRVGSTHQRSADVRLVCATNRSLKAMVEEGSFRQDLYYRIAVFPVHLPALRERREDVPMIAVSLLEQMAERLGGAMKLSREAQVRLLGYDFPGNIRELRNILQLAAALSDGGVIGAEQIQLPDMGLFPARSQTLGAEDSDEGHVEASPLQAMEARYIADLLARHNGRRSAVAQAMGVSERTLYRKLKRFELN